VDPLFSRRAVPRIDGVFAASQLAREDRAPATRWSRADLAGRLVELSGQGDSSALSLAVSLVTDAQKEGETTAWVTPGQSVFFPPDAARAGVDLGALPVIRVPGPDAVARTAERLVRSGAFGLVVLDLSAGARARDGVTRVPPALQNRLAGLAKKHGTAVLCLTEKPPHAPSLGSLVSLRAEARRLRTGENRFQCEVRVLRDKRRAGSWRHVEDCRGPAGLR
jgi:recombination protein RecA